jgi:DNA polymerase-3 subunit beta
MTLKIKKEILLNILKNSTLFSNKKTFNEEFKSIKFCVENGLLTTTTKSNFVSGIVFTTKVEYNGLPFTFDVDVFKLLETVKCAEKNSLIELYTENQTLRVKTGLMSDKLEFITEFQDSTPKKQEKQALIRMNVAELLQAIKQTKATIFPDYTRYNINGLNFDLSDNSLKIISTDGHRLSKFEAECLSIVAFGEKKSFTIPKKEILNIEKVIKQIDGDVCITYTDIGYNISLSECQVFGKTIEDTFPNWRQVVPSSFRSYVKVNAKELLEVAKIIELKGKGRRETPCLVSIQNNKMNLSVDWAEIDLNKSIPVECEPEYTFYFKVNIFYLVENLKSCESDFIIFQFNNQKDPFIMSADGNEKFKVLTMPMK